jgi:hypothetical protein
VSGVRNADEGVKAGKVTATLAGERSAAEQPITALHRHALRSTRDNNMGWRTKG